jgi:hypothetical protein
MADTSMLIGGSRPGAEIGERPVRGVSIRPTSERQERICRFMTILALMTP